MSTSMEPIRGKRVYILTLGCKVNQYESDAMYEALFSAGAVQGTEDASDICIVNTCSVTNIADGKSRQMLSRLKKENPDAILVATGCYVQALAERGESLSSVDLIIGNNRKRDILRILTEYLTGEPVRDNMVDIAKDPEFENLRIEMPLTHTRSYIKIQDGCNSFCSYCIIPYVRGRIRNKSLTDIVRETEVLAEHGVKELVLTGINISSYGDIGDHTLADVIEAMHDIPGILRIRLGSLEPRIISEEFMQRMVKLPKVCPHFHLSLQSGCDTVLKRMNRKYTVADIDAIVSRIRKYYDRPALTADIIVGFPGETGEEFRTTAETLDRISLYTTHVFKYSRRKGTVADRMPDQLTDAVKSSRSHELLELSNRKKKEYEALFAHEPLNVLVEEIVENQKGSFYRGHTERYMLVDIPIADAGDSEPDPKRINTVLNIDHR